MDMKKALRVARELGARPRWQESNAREDGRWLTEHHRSVEAKAVEILIADAEVLADQENTLVFLPGVGPFGYRVFRFLRRPSTRPTWWYERVVLIVCVELPLLLAAVLVQASWSSRAVALLGGLAGLDAAIAAHTTRSGASRKAEAARRSGASPYRLACEKQIERAAARSQIHAGAAPIVGLALGAGMTGAVTSAMIVAAAGTALRTIWALAVYPAWRGWWSARRG